MNYYDAGKCDIVVIGAGHAGIEAALSAARLGRDTVCFTVSLDAVGNMPCNPAIGGTGKGHLVRELDALGGEMARAADKACIQYRMLNLGKGPAVHSLRAQADRRRYQEVMKHTLELQDNLRLKQGEVISIGVEDGQVVSVTTDKCAVYKTKAVVVATGTYLGGRTITGEAVRDSGPDGLAATLPLTECLRSLGLRMRRFKTGTPPRVNARSVDFSKMQIQYGDEEIEPFSFSTTEPLQNRVTCWLTYTNAETHRIIRENLDRIPLYSGVIEGVGPRYCPSIETKIVTFADKEAHQLFLEPEGVDSNEDYVNGFSSSLPWQVQLAGLKTVKGLEDIVMYRPGYAIEYDFFDPTQLHHTLETKQIKNLFFAGQINGTTGYEEAAGQGLVAGVNAHINVHGGAPFTMGRDESYIGVLIDDLVNKGVDEPYRMFTSRAEYRILLRQDNADERLTKRSWEMGLADKYRYDLWCKKEKACADFIDYLHTNTVRKGTIDGWLESIGSSALHEGCKTSNLILRPQVSIKALAEVVPELKAKITELTDEVVESCEIQIKYAGYIKREQMEAAKLQRLDQIRIPDGFNYEEVQSLSTEARQKLSRIRPKSIGEAQRIPGVSPNDISVLLVLMGR